METLAVIGLWILIAMFVALAIKGHVTNIRIQNENIALELENERLRKELTKAQDLCFAFRDLFK